MTSQKIMTKTKLKFALKMNTGDSWRKIKNQAKDSQYRPVKKCLNIPDTILWPAQDIPITVD